MTCRLIEKLCLSSILLLLFASGIHADEKKTLLIMFDGCRADVMYSAPTPNIDSIRDGTWAEGYKGTWSYEGHTNLDAPPSSATNHVAIATGVTATKNGCYQNGTIKNAKWSEYPSWMERLRKINPEIKTVWLYNWSEDADLQTQATFQGPPRSGFDGDMELIQDTVALLDGSFPNTDGLNDTHWIQGDQPDAIMLYLDSMDMFGHGFGFSVFVPEYYEKMSTYDAKIGDILNAIRNRPTFSQEDWLIVICSDHGGIEKSHGVVHCENCYTVPLIISSKTVKPGRMKGEPKNCFAAAYVMQHMTGSIPPEFDGTIADVYETETNALTDELTSVFSFEKNLNDACETLNLKPVKKEAEFTEGKVGSAIRFTGDYYLNLGKPESLTNSRKDFTLTFWFRADGSIDNDPPFISNKNWENGLNPGIVVAANYSKPGNNATFNLGDGKIRDDLNPLTYEPGQWYFFAVTVDRDANAVFYLGDSAGKLAFISDDISEQGSFDSGLDWNLGQDGTGNYPATLTGVMDELGIWGRPLRQNEIQAVYQLGLNGQSLTK